MKQALIVALLGAVVLASGCAMPGEACPGLEGAEFEMCIWDAAVARQDISLCNRIENASDEEPTRQLCIVQYAEEYGDYDACDAMGGPDRETYVMLCTIDVAKAKGDPEGCSRIEDAAFRAVCQAEFLTG